MYDELQKSCVDLINLLHYVFQNCGDSSFLASARCLPRIGGQSKNGDSLGRPCLTGQTIPGQTIVSRTKVSAFFCAETDVCGIEKCRCKLYAPQRRNITKDTIRRVQDTKNQRCRFGRAGCKEYHFEIVQSDATGDEANFSHGRDYCT